MTCDHWVRKTVRAGRLHAQTVVCEEVSQISSYLWNDVAKAALAGVQFLLLGDFAQLGVVLDSWAGAVVPEGAFETSDLLHELSGGVRLTLTECRRCDAELFQFYTSLGLCRTGGLRPVPRDLAEALAEARLRYPKQAGDPTTTLVLAHARRVHINRSQNLREKPKGAIFCKAPPGKKRGENQPQSMWVYVGQRLITAKVRRGLFVFVTAATAEGVTLDDGRTLACEDVCENLRLSHAVTFASCQGLTLQRRVRLETDHQAFTLTHLYVGTSRATAGSLLEVC